MVIIKHASRAELDNLLKEFVEEYGIHKLQWKYLRPAVRLRANDFGGIEAFVRRAGMYDVWADEFVQEHKVLKNIKKYVAQYGILALTCDQMTETGEDKLYRQMCNQIGIPSIVLKKLDLTEEFEAAQKQQQIKNFKERFQKLAQENGADVFFLTWLKHHNFGHWFNQGKALGISLQDLAAEFGYHEASDEIKRRSDIKKKSQPAKAWSLERLDRETKSIIEKWGAIPPLDVLSKAGYGGYANGLAFAKISIQQQREKYSVDKLELRSIDFQYWLSSCEAAVANFLLSRGVLVKPGKHYPIEYGDNYDASFGIYDMHFEIESESMKNEEALIEIWGVGGKSLESREKYEKTRKSKEDFNKDNPYFIGIECKDAINDEQLEKIFVPFIGIKQITKHHQDFPQLPPTRWSIADGVMKLAKHIIKNIPGGVFPGPDWLRRKNKFIGRKIFEWELKSYEHFIDNIYLTGGFRKLREALGQGNENKNVSWTKERVIDEFQAIYKEFNKTPAAAASHLARSIEEFDEEQIAWRRRIHNAVMNCRNTHGGHRAACLAAGLMKN